MGDSILQAMVFRTLGERVQMEQLQGMLIMLIADIIADSILQAMVFSAFRTLGEKVQMEQLQGMLILHRWHAALAQQRKQQTIFIKRRSVCLNKVYPVTCCFFLGGDQPSVSDLGLLSLSVHSAKI